MKRPPEIDPPCPDCLRAREEHGKDAWCARHSRHAASAHHYAYAREVPFATHDSEVVPTGIKF